MPFPKPQTELGEIVHEAIGRAADQEATAGELLASLVQHLNLESVLSLLAEHCEELADAYLEDYKDETKYDQLTDAAYRISRLSQRIGRDDPTA